jgi:uncharacterized protein YyaL (SSP411 family)
MRPDMAGNNEENATSTTEPKKGCGSLSFENRYAYRMVTLRGLMNWLATAQDATSDDGVAQAYFTTTKRWAASYPETTGYIIPTFFDYATITNDSQFRERAVRMAKWEQSIQLPEGGIQASTIDYRPIVGTVFNTGMVIFGWIRAYEETLDVELLECAIRAAAWLQAIQDDDGAWRRYGSPITRHSLNTYNAAVALALLEVDRVAPDKRLRVAARRNLDWVLAQRQDTGWLAHNCFIDNAQPYTHTIAYAMQGLLESAVLLQEPRYLQAAESIYRGIEPSIHDSGFLAGRFDRNWNATVNYCCLTGSAQLALHGFRLYRLTANRAYNASARRLLDFVIQTQNLHPEDSNISGAIAGSWPISGEYHPNQYPNWAAKFTADAIMASLSLDGLYR